MLAQTSTPDSPRRVIFACSPESRTAATSHPFTVSLGLFGAHEGLERRRRERERQGEGEEREREREGEGEQRERESESESENESEIDRESDSVQSPCSQAWLPNDCPHIPVPFNLPYEVYIPYILWHLARQGISSLHVCSLQPSQLEHRKPDLQNNISHGPDARNMSSLCVRMYVRTYVSMYVHTYIHQFVCARACLCGHVSDAFLSVHP